MSKSQTDRQTDKATYWSITEFDEEYQNLLQSGEYPDWVFKIYGGLETCPETGREHFQGAIQCRRQVRFSAVKQWLPKAHIEAARSKDALIKYAMKSETAVGDKREVKNVTEYWDMERLFLEMSRYAYDDDKYYGLQREYSLKVVDDMEYWSIVRSILDVDGSKVSMFATPQVKTIWTKTRTVWIKKRAAFLGGADSITAPPEELKAPRKELMSPTQVIEIVE